MISQKLIEQAKEFSYGEYEKYQTPIEFFVDLANKKAQELSTELKANKDIVILGMILMDSLLGKATKENRAKEHVLMAEEWTKGLLGRFQEVTEEEHENILHCIREHHGVSKFYSLESEICCNADCYKFISARGFSGGLYYYGAYHFKDENVEDRIKTLLIRMEEKWNALTLDICKQELEPQYKAIKNLLGYYQ